MRNNRVIQAAFILMVTVMVSLNIRLLIGNREQDDLEFEVNCRRVFQGYAEARPVNLSETWWQWRELNTSKARALGYYRGRKGFLTIGVPSIKRENGMQYLMKTISSLIDKTTSHDKAETIVLIYLCDLDQEYNKEVLAEVSSKYLAYVDMGFLHILQASLEVYPALVGLKLNFKDSPERVQWRAKQVVDFSFMFQYSANLSSYYIQLEDDVVAAPSFVPAIRDYIRKQKTHWAVLEFSELGFIGKLFRSTDLPKLTKFMMTFYEEQPVDWLIRYYRMAMTQTKILLRKPTLFQHFGLTSSFDTSKQNKLQDRFFDSGDKKWRSDDPPGGVFTNLHAYKGHTPDLAYGSGSGYFWAKEPKEGNAIYIVFDSVEKLDRVVIETGHPEHKDDFLRHGTLEVSPKLLRVDGQKVTCADWRVIGQTTQGIIDAKDLRQKLAGRRTKCLKVTITSYQSQWIVFNQVAVFTAKDPEAETKKTS